MRKLYMEGGLSYSAIAGRMNCDWRTVKKYVGMDNFSPEQVAPVHRGSKLDPYKPFIDEILEGDSKIRYHKQRHTATRIFERLKEEKGYDGGFTLVSSCVRPWKYDHVGKPAYIPPYASGRYCAVQLCLCCEGSQKCVELAGFSFGHVPGALPDRAPAVAQGRTASNFVRQDQNVRRQVICRQIHLRVT